MGNRLCSAPEQRGRATQPRGWTAQCEGKVAEKQERCLKTASGTPTASPGFPSPALTMGAPLRQQYGSPGPSSMAPTGQPSAAAIQYRIAAGVMASPGQVGHIPGYMYPAPKMSTPVYGSPQQMGGLAQLLGSSPMQTGPPLTTTVTTTTSVRPGGASRPGAH